MQRGQREAAPTCGGFPHQRLPWLPTGLQRCSADLRGLPPSATASTQVLTQVTHTATLTTSDGIKTLNLPHKYDKPYSSS
ncbi:hypothetical protein [Moorena sp. SIO3H5]|uniref:hypothetical protein n=1 Tax=Moorena sp. SIO3H5 TaxID=2607834 RepID=UPI0013B71476|nr:hypothetical protein [Moorena sp. SIO3H5]NEO73794.1 hypothetical protein [Moorena sp. SIO3H5]